MAIALLGAGTSHAADRMLDATMHHLGSGVMKDWTDAPPEPAGTRLDLRFSATANAGEWTLSLRQRDVDNVWHIEINGRRVGELKRAKPAEVRFFALSPGVLKDGENVLSIVPKDPKDDIAVGMIHLTERPLRETMRLVPVRVKVRDESKGQALPARLTITDLQDRLVEVHYAARESTAVRPGIVYTGTGDATFEVPEGSYILYATRGMEWSRVRLPITLARGETPQLDLTLRREVDTTGFIAADTHIHTLTFSGHGDSSIDERMITIAAEGVELAVATDHNHHTDYEPYQRKAGLSEHFRPVTGNEVTTENGHFNAFPLDPNGPKPDHKQTNWVQLVSDIRTKGAKVVILNHPRWPSLTKSPLGVFGLNRGSGERLTGPEFTFDGIELINSAEALQKDPLYLFQDWFALLNRGDRITAVGSSDSHTVHQPVGQGRTYVRSSTDDPARIDVDEACAAFLAGDTSISMGIFTDVVVGGGIRMGQLAKISNRVLDLKLTIRAPSWITPTRAIIYLNGAIAAEMSVPATAGQPTDASLSFRLRTPPHDAYLVCVVLGPGVKEPCWTTHEDYTLAATNPVYLDVDGDGRYSSPRETARAMLGTFEGNTRRLRRLMRQSDEAVSLQLVSLARADALARLDEIVSSVADTNQVFELYRKHLPPPLR